MSASQDTPLRAVLGRLTWMVFAPLALLLTTFAIVQTGYGWLTGADVAFFAALGAMLLGRWVEFQTGFAQTAEGEPATPADFRRYLVGATTIGLFIWVGANLLANHGLAR